MAEKRKSKKKAADFTLLLSVIILVFIGIIMVFSASWPEAMVEFDNGYHFLRKQLTAAIIGFVVMIFMMNFDYRYLRKFSLLIYIVSIVLGLLIFTPLGYEYLGARRWINLGFTTFMPSDLIKMGSIIFFANFLANKKGKISTLLQGTVPALFYIGLSCGLIYLQKDLGTTVTLAGAMIGMFFIAGMKLTHMISMAGGAGLLFYLAVRGPDNAYRLDRFKAWLDPFAYKLDEGWQAVQSLYALGSGGLFGLGLGKSRQKFFYIPMAYNDFIFSIIGEELGFLGGAVVLILFMIVIWRGIIIALRIEDLFGCFLATGITALLAVQSLINVAVATSSIPTTGITLPLISNGGTSLIAFMASLGILLNISRHAKLDRS